MAREPRIGPNPIPAIARPYTTPTDAMASRFVRSTRIVVEATHTEGTHALVD